METKLPLLVVLAATTVLAAPTLPPTQPVVKIRSWAADKSLVPGRNADSTMHMDVRSAHPDSTFVIERQKRSVPIDVPSEIRDEAHLRDLARQATKWVPYYKFVTTNDAHTVPHYEAVDDPMRVMRPHSRFRAVARTREGTEFMGNGGVVEGLQATKETRFNPISGAIENISLSGNLLKPARAWIEPALLYVSKPRNDPEKVAAGQAKLKAAQDQKAIIDKEQFDFDAVKSKMSLPDQKATTERIATLTKEYAALAIEGKQLVADGERHTIEVVSLGALPVNTPTTITNVRLRAEQGRDATGPAHTRVVTSGLSSGLLLTTVEAIERDRIALKVQFAAPTAEPSAADVSFRVPTGEGQKPSFRYAGQDYYAVQVEEPQK